jgi:hypothetical protein
VPLGWYPLPSRLKTELLRELDRLELVMSQPAALEAERDSVLQADQVVASEKTQEAISATAPTGAVGSQLNVCSLVGLDGGGRVVLRRRLKRSSVADFAQKWPGCVVAMEACCGAHHLGRQRRR